MVVGCLYVEGVLVFVDLDVCGVGGDLCVVVVLVTVFVDEGDGG